MTPAAIALALVLWIACAGLTMLAKVRFIEPLLTLGDVLMILVLWPLCALLLIGRALDSLVLFDRRKG